MKNLESKDYQKTQTFINETKYLFKGATGVRHVDFIGYKKAMKINSFNEWDPLKEVILGSADKQSAVLTWETKSKIHEENFEKAKNFLKKPIPNGF